MKRNIIIACMILFSGCALASQDLVDLREIILSKDFTGDGTTEEIILVPSFIEMNDEFSETYPYTFTELFVKSNERQLMHINAEGIQVENGDIIRPQISSQSAYAVQLGEQDLMYIVQIDEEGNPVSEPITINWDKETQSWKMN